MVVHPRDTDPGLDALLEVVAVDVAGDHADIEAITLLATRLIETGQALIQLWPGPGDARREDERDLQLVADPHIRAHVLHEVRHRELLARPQPVRTPILARALGDHVVDSPLHRLIDRR